MMKKTQAEKVITHIEDTYGDVAEYLFETSDTVVFRKGTKKKWYAVIMYVSKRKLGIDSDEKVQILNVKLSPDFIALAVDYKGYFPAYHMNKKHWCTIILDDTLQFNEICYAVEQSYNLVKG